MLDYYTARDASAAPALHVFAPEYYAGGEDARNLLAALDQDPHQFAHVWLFVAGNGTPQTFENGGALADKLQTIYGQPIVHSFAGVTLFEYGR
jgi:hypothetical protein